jgi:hypothetical protein
MFSQSSFESFSSFVFVSVTDKSGVCLDDLRSGGVEPTFGGVFKRECGREVGEIGRTKGCREDLVEFLEDL